MYLGLGLTHVYCVFAQSLSRVRLCDLGDCSTSDSSVHGISQARILGWVAISFSGDHPNPGIKPMSLVSSALAGGFFTIEPPGKPMYPLPCVK